jgi:hypothetical protein
MAWALWRWELVNVANRYSPVTVALLVSSFALVGYMGARLSDRMSHRERARPTPPTIGTAGDTNAAAAPKLSGITLTPKKPAEPTVDSPPAQAAQAPPVVLLNPGSAEQSRGQAKGLGQAEAPTEQADVPKPDGHGLRKSEQAAAAPQTPVDGLQIENPRSKVARKHRSGYRQVAEEDDPPRKPYPRGYREPRGYMPGQGGHLIPFLPFLPF